MKSLIIIASTLLFIVFPKESTAQYYQQDKKLHLAAGGIITTTTFLIVKDYFPGKTKQETKAKAFKVNLITVTSLALAKELYDYNYHKKNNSWNYEVRRDSYNDVAITLLSGLSVSAAIPIFYK